jgi:hypothetical protein
MKGDTPMKIHLRAMKPVNNSKKDIEFDEFVWHPLRSIWAIANHRIYEQTGSLPKRYDWFQDIETNHGHFETEEWKIQAWAQEMKNLKEQPEILSDYGISVEIKNGKWIYTYPVAMCTACLEHKETGELVSEKKDHDPDDLISSFQATEEDLQQLINFVENSNGIMLP